MSADLRQHARECAEQFDTANRTMSLMEREHFEQALRERRMGEPYPQRWTPAAGLCEVYSLAAWDSLTCGWPSHPDARRIA